MLCQTANRSQCYNLIQSTQNDSTSVEHNSKTQAQNKFNTCPKFNFISKQPFALIVAHCPLSIFSSLYASPLYGRSCDTNLLINARPFSNSLEKAPFLKPSSIYAKILQVASYSGAWTKTLRHYCWTKKEKRDTYIKQ